jgi:cytochrome c oxidase assembly factor CtaG
VTTRDLLLTCWRFDPLALVVSGAALVAWIMASRAAGFRGVRTLSMATAIALFVIALASPVGVLAGGYLFSAHMLKKLLLVLVVPPLVLLAMPESTRERAPHVITRVLFAPIVTWGLGVGAMWLWHAPTLCNASANSPLMQRVQEVSLLAMGTAFWWPIVSPRLDARMRPLGGALYLFTACTACTVLGILVTFSPVEICSIFRHHTDSLGVMPLIRERWGLSLERDQVLGGLFMWVPACLVYGGGILGLLARWYREDAHEETTTEGAPVAEELS